MLINQILLATANAAQTAAKGGDAAPQGSMWTFMVPLLIVIVVMTFISGRSQRKQREKQQKMYESIVKGTKIRTIGGFTGKVGRTPTFVTATCSPSGKTTFVA